MSFDSAVVDSLDRYCRAMWAWNEKLNLTRHTDFDRFVSRDLADARHLAGQLAEGEEVLDVGSGGGVPGALLAILRPDLEVTLSDSVGKKAAALADIVGHVGLPTPVHHGRAEELFEDFRYTTVTARAVGPLKKLLTWFRPHWDAIERLLLIKGPAWVAERAEARHLGLFRGLLLRKVDEYPLAGTESQSVILMIRPQ